MISPDNLVQQSIVFSQQSEELYWRQSSHLSYYAIYHKLLKQAALKQIDLTQGSGGVHHKAITSIKNYSEQGYKLALKLQKMKKLRVSADYYLDEDFLQEDAQLQQVLMQQCLKDLIQL